MIQRSYLSEETIENLELLKRDVGSQHRCCVLRRNNQRRKALEAEALNTSYFIEYPEALHSNRTGRKSRKTRRDLRNLESAWGFCRDEVGQQRLTRENLIEVQRRILGQPSAAYRKHDVKISLPDSVPPPPVQYVKEYMEDTFGKLVQMETSSHPVERAAFAHLSISFVHPFSDGNGRTARLAQNFMLVRDGYIPAVIPAFERQLYFSVLQGAIRGIINDDTKLQRPFFEYIASKVHSGLEIVLG